MVIAEPSLQHAMEGWAEHRRAEGYRIAFQKPSEFLLGGSGIGTGRVVLFVGDGVASGVPPARFAARIVSRFGPEEDIATDVPLARRVSGCDGVARIPLNDPDALRSYLARVIEREHRPGSWGDLRLQIAAGDGGFSSVIDAAIERAAGLIVSRLAPREATLSLRRHDEADVRSARRLPADRGGVFVWLGHGLRDALPGVAAERLAETCGGADVAVLLACYTGDFAASGDCVAERLLAAREGPLAVIAATRVTMPYGNARLGAELLCGLRDGEGTPAGLLVAAARRRTVEDQACGELRGLDDLATLVGADRSLLRAEREEHALAYQLLGDPLLRVRKTLPLRLDSPSFLGADEPLTIRGVVESPGKLSVAVLSPGVAGDGSDRRGNESFVQGAFQTVVEPTEDWRAGRRIIRVGVETPRGLEVGAVEVVRRGKSRTRLAGVAGGSMGR